MTTKTLLDDPIALLQFLGDGGGRGLLHYRIVNLPRADGAGAPLLIDNGPLRRLALILSRQSATHKAVLRHELRRRLDALREGACLNEGGAAPDALLLAAQRFNQSLSAFLDDGAPPRNTLLADLWLSQEHYLHGDASLEPVTLERLDTSTIADDELPQPYRHQGLYYFSPDDRRLRQRREGLAILWHTQAERCRSALGKALGALGLDLFRDSHYFRHGEDRQPRLLYADDAPLNRAAAPSTFWIGHASCLLHLPLRSIEDGSLGNVTILTDPVEGDLNALLYPRMTKEGLLCHQYPAIHVILLSHRHLDHFDPTLLRRLTAQQPLVIAPCGDGALLRRLGFAHVVELSWWQTASAVLRRGQRRYHLRVSAVPARHWSGIGLFDQHRSLFCGYVLESDALDGAIYYAGDTARLADSHLHKLTHHFDIRVAFQPGGPDERRPLMASTHQSSADALLVHWQLLLARCRRYGVDDLPSFMRLALAQRTVYMHTKTYKLGNLHYDDTDRSVARVLEALEQHTAVAALRPHEREVFAALCAGDASPYGGGTLTPPLIAALLRHSVLIPKIGQRLDLSDPL